MRPSQRNVYCPCILCAEWRLADHRQALPGDTKKLIGKYEDQPGGMTKFSSLEAMREYTSARTPLRDYTSEERKSMPVVKGALQYFPDAIAAIARVSVKGNDKHNPGQPLHWSRGKSNDHLNCVGRHIMTPDAIDSDSGEIELAHGAWRVLAALQLAEEKRLVAAGIKPLSGVIT